MKKNLIDKKYFKNIAQTIVILFEILYYKREIFNLDESIFPKIIFSYTTLIVILIMLHKVSDYKMLKKFKLLPENQIEFIKFRTILSGFMYSTIFIMIQLIFKLHNVQISIMLGVILAFIYFTMIKKGGLFGYVLIKMNFKSIIYEIGTVQNLEALLKDLEEHEKEYGKEVDSENGEYNEDESEKEEED